MNTVSHWKEASTRARSLSDAELVSNLESLRAERSAIVDGTPFDLFDWVRLEMLYRRGMTAHAKLTRIAEARAELGVAA